MGRTLMVTAAIFLAYGLMASIHGEAEVLWKTEVEPKAAQPALEARVAPQKEAFWTIFIVVEARNNLLPFLTLNLEDMVRVGSVPGHLNICVQMYQSNKPGASRYIINKGKATLIQQLPQTHHTNIIREIHEGALWAYKNYPAQHYGLILWDHGTGIIDPMWGIPRTRIPRGDLSFAHPGLCMPSPESNPECERGILFDEASKTYVNNQQLVEVLSLISKQVLGRPLDLLGMDACLMAMLEVAYQVAPFAKILVASEDVEHAYGWPYAAFLWPLSNRYVSPQELAMTIVATFDLFYKRGSQIYTLSAINLEHMEVLRSNIDQVVANLQQCARHFGLPAVRALVHEARRLCQHFNTPSYIDLHSFYQNLHSVLTNTGLKQFSMSGGGETTSFSGVQLCDTMLSDTFSPRYNPRILALNDDLAPEKRDVPRIMLDSSGKVPRVDASVAPVLRPLPGSSEGQRLMDRLKESLQLGMELVTSAVLLSVAKKDMPEARGISIYYPRYRIDRSYLLTEFAKKSKWLEFLQDHG